MFIFFQKKKENGLKREGPRNTLNGVAHPKLSYFIRKVAPCFFIFLSSHPCLSLLAFTLFASFTLTPTSHHSRHPLLCYFSAAEPLPSAFPLSLHLSLVSLSLSPLGCRRWWSGWAVVAGGREWETWKWGGDAICEWQRTGVGKVLFWEIKKKRRQNEVVSISHVLDSYPAALNRTQAAPRHTKLFFSKKKILGTYPDIPRHILRCIRTRNALSAGTFAKPTYPCFRA